MSELVSIIMPSYNTADYIAESIRSVQMQTYTDWELLIVDDDSTDDTDHIVEKYLEDKRIRYFKNEYNSGAALSRNKALRESKGKWIAFLDSDDLWLPEKLEKQIKFMNQNGYHFSYTDYEEIDESGRRSGTKVTGPDKITRRGFFNYCWPGCLTVMYDKNHVGEIQVADIRKNNDYAMWLAVSRNAVCHLLHEDLARYRKRNGSISNHGYLSLVKWHYRLFREAENESALTAAFNTLRNLFFGVMKKVIYVKHE